MNPSTLFRPSPRRWLASNRKPKARVPMPSSSKSKVLFEVFVPQTFSAVTIRRTVRAWEMDVTNRNTGAVNTCRHPRPSPSYSNAIFAHDFECAMSMPGSKPL